MNQPGSPRLILPHGGYRKLRSFRSAEEVYDATVLFCERFVDKRSRTHDQMVQAARSGVQNIAEGSMASATSKKTEMKLTNVARASLEELQLDYQDFLRQRGMQIWDKDSPHAVNVRSRYLAQEPDISDPHGIGTADAEAAANTLICMINQASYLLGRQLKALDRQFQEEGGFTERLHNVRSNYRESGKHPSDLSDASDLSDLSDNLGPAQPPACPKCGKPMVSRVARQGTNPGQSFWGCTGYPECKGTRKQA
ncbi:MAG: four helix bundle suffix domain-containing protein [Capsulimonadaceae bacterium]